MAGDAVNTAARVQTAAAPGQVWVDDATYALSSGVISYVDVGEHELKGKSGAVKLAGKKLEPKGYDHFRNRS